MNFYMIIYHSWVGNVGLIGWQRYGQGFSIAKPLQSLTVDERSQCIIENKQAVSFAIAFSTNTEKRYTSLNVFPQTQGFSIAKPLQLLVVDERSHILNNKKGDLFYLLAKARPTGRPLYPLFPLKNIDSCALVISTAPPRYIGSATIYRG